MSHRRLWIQVGLIFVVLYLALLWARPMVTPDEARYGAMATEMLASGEWFKLRMLGFTYFEKPPFGTWCIAASVATFGHNAFAIRLPSAIASLITALAAGMVASKMTSRRVSAPLAAMVQLTMVFPMVIGTVAIFDSIFTAWTTLAIAFFFVATESTHRPRAAWLVASGVAAGLAFLTKGLLGLAIPALAAFTYLCWQKRWRDVFTMPWLPLLGATLSAGPLAWKLHQSEPEFWNYFVLVEHVRRFASPDSNQHPQPWWLLSVVLLGGSTFWILIAPRAWKALRGHLALRSGLRFCWCWIVPPLLAMSLSKGKLPTYVLPLFPAIAVMLSIGLLQWREGTSTSRDRATWWVQWIVRCLAVAMFAFALADWLHWGAPILWLDHSTTRWFLFGIVFLAWSWLDEFAHQATAAVQWLVRTAWVAVPLLACVHVFMPTALLSPTKAPWDILQQAEDALRNSIRVVAINPMGHSIGWVSGRTDIVILGDPGEFDNELGIPQESQRLISVEQLGNLLPQWLTEGSVTLALETDRAAGLAKRFSTQVQSQLTDRSLTVLTLRSITVDPDTHSTQP